MLPETRRNLLILGSIAVAIIVGITVERSIASGDRAPFPGSPGYQQQAGRAATSDFPTYDQLVANWRRRHATEHYQQPEYAWLQIKESRKLIDTEGSSATSISGFELVAENVTIAYAIAPHKIIVTGRVVGQRSINNDGVMVVGQLNGNDGGAVEAELLMAVFPDLEVKEAIEAVASANEQLNKGAVPFRDVTLKAQWSPTSIDFSIAKVE